MCVPLHLVLSDLFLVGMGEKTGLNLSWETADAYAAVPGQVLITRTPESYSPFRSVSEGFGSNVLFAVHILPGSRVADISNPACTAPIGAQEEREIIMPAGSRLMVVKSYRAENENHLRGRFLNSCCFRLAVRDCCPRTSNLPFPRHGLFMMIVRLFRPVVHDHGTILPLHNDLKDKCIRYNVLYLLVGF